MRKHYQEMKTYILENLSPDGVFTKKYGEISQDLSMNINVVRNIIIDIVNDGILEVISPPTRGKGSNPIYKIKNAKLTMKEVIPVTSEDTKVITFEGVEIVLISTDLGYVIDRESLAMCTLENTFTLDKIVKSNKELFDGHIITIDEKQYFDRFATSAFLLKLNLDNCHPLKKDMLLKFQTHVVNMMCESQLRAKLVMTEDRKVQIRHNLNCILELDSEQVEGMLTDLEYQFSKVVDIFSVNQAQLESKATKTEKQLHQIEHRLDAERQAKDVLVTENRQLKNKLMERN